MTGSSPLGSYTYGDAAHVDVATAIGSAYTASYDAAGNMQCRAATSATTCTGTQTGAQLSYDNEGQLAAWQNAPSSPTTTDSFLYDGEGHRIEQVASSSGTTTSTTYVGELEEVATTGSTTTTTAYYGGVALSVNGTLSYTLSDSLNSVSVSVSSSGSVTATQLYGPYGNVRYSQGTLPGSQSYIGQQADATTGLDYFTARYYDPVAGAFVSADTTTAGGLNLYSYVDGNPATLTDPSGHCPWCIAALVGAVVGGAIDYGSQVAANVANGGSLSDASTWTNVSWGQVGMSALAGGLIGLTGGLVGAGIAAGGAGILGDVGAEVAGRVVTGGVEGGLNQIAGNVISGRNWSDGVLQATAVGLVTAGASEAGGALFSKLSGGASEVADEAASDVGPVCGLSFAATTPVATPSGEQPIASLQVGEQVLAYDSTTGKQTTQTIKQVWLNHDSDRLDVTLALPTAQPTTRGATTTSQTMDTETTRAQRAQVVAGHGLRAPPDATSAATTSGSATTTTTSASDTEVIHTTSNHPWLTAAQGWQVAGDLRVGEAVRLLDGGTATVVALQTLPGVGAMWDLSLDSVHTFAVGAVQAVVHNCPIVGPGGSTGSGAQTIGGRTGDITPSQPGDYLAGKSPMFGDPNSARDGVYVNDIGQIQPWRAHYDQFGRLIARTDYNAANPAAGIPAIHYHLYTWGAGCDGGCEDPLHYPGEYQP